MTELEALAKWHGTDKGVHGYCSHYERFIGDMKLLPITMIEIGVAGGDSLRMWREWMPNAKIYGFDSNGYNGDDFIVVRGNQSEPNDLEQLLKVTGNFHLLIDDGSHNSEHQKISFTTLWPRLLPGGWYVIEDSFGIGSCFDLDAVANGGNDIDEVHLIGHSGNVILFLKKR